MNKTSNFKFSWRAVNALASWRLEILSASILFLCVAITFQGSWRAGRMAAKEIIDLENRLLFVKQHARQPGEPAAPPRNRTKADAAQTITGIRQAAQASGVAVNRLSIKPEDISKEKNLSVLPLEFSAMAPQGAFLLFMNRLKSMDFLCRIVFLNAKPDPSNDANLILSMKAERVNLLSPVTPDSLKKAAADFRVDDIQSPAKTRGQRNIFKNIIQPARRVVQAASSDPDALNIKDLSLAGIVDNGRPKAIIENKKDSKIYYLAKGDEIGDLCVADILGQEAFLERGQERYRLTL